MRRDDNETKRVNKKRPDETRKYKSNIRGYQMRQEEKIQYDMKRDQVRKISQGDMRRSR